jgi:Fic family protein
MVITNKFKSCSKRRPSQKEARLLLPSSLSTAESPKISLTPQSKYSESNTAYYDALGYAINKLSEETDMSDEFNSYLVVAISDGEDNASRVWDKHKLNARIDELEKTNRWTFTFMGANVDIRKIGSDLGLKGGNTIAFASTSRGTATAFHTNAVQMKKYLDRKSESLKVGSKFAMHDFYEGATSAEELLKKQEAEKTKNA